MKGSAAVLWLAVGAWAALPRVDVGALIARSVAANNRDWQLAPQYTYSEKDRSDGGTETYQVSMLYGSPYRKLIAVNGKPLPFEEQAEQNRKYQEAAERRQRESPSQRSERVADYETGRRRDHAMIGQLTQAFDFRLLGLEKLGGRSVYVLQATPRPGYVPPNPDTRVLTGMRGKLWIDPQSGQWVKVEARVTNPVWMKGFFAQVEPGTQFELDYAPVSGDVWLPTHYAMRARAKVLWVLMHREHEEQRFSQYAIASKAERAAAGPAFVPQNARRASN